MRSERILTSFLDSDLRTRFPGSRLGQVTACRTGQRLWLKFNDTWKSNACGARRCTAYGTWWLMWDVGADGPYDGQPQRLQHGSTAYIPDERHYIIAAPALTCPRRQGLRKKQRHRRLSMFQETNGGSDSCVEASAIPRPPGAAPT